MRICFTLSSVKRLNNMKYINLKRWRILKTRQTPTKILFILCWKWSCAKIQMSNRETMNNYSIFCSLFQNIVSTKLLGISVYFFYSFIVALRQLPSIQLLMFHFQCFIWGHNRKRNSIIRFFWQVHLLFLFVASDNGTEEYLNIKLLNVSERTLILISSFCWCIFTLVNIFQGKTIL